MPSLSSLEKIHHQRHQEKKILIIFLSCSLLVSFILHVTALQLRVIDLWGTGTPVIDDEIEIVLEEVEVPPAVQPEDRIPEAQPSPSHQVFKESTPDPEPLLISKIQALVPLTTENATQAPLAPAIANIPDPAISPILPTPVPEPQPSISPSPQSQVLPALVPEPPAAPLSVPLKLESPMPFISETPTAKTVPENLGIPSTDPVIPLTGLSENTPVSTSGSSLKSDRQEQVQSAASMPSQNLIGTPNGSPLGTPDASLTGIPNGQQTGGSSGNSTRSAYGSAGNSAGNSIGNSTGNSTENSPSNASGSNNRRKSPPPTPKPTVNSTIPKCIRCPLPQYRGSEGSPRVVYDITPEGRVVNVRLRESSGDPQSDREVLETLLRWRFDPKTVVGGRQNIRVRITFEHQGSTFQRQNQERRREALNKPPQPTHSNPPVQNPLTDPSESMGSETLPITPTNPEPSAIQQ